MLHATILLSTVAMLISMGFFFLGSLPLLVLKHDKPMDARFIRCVFNTHYVATLGIATIATVGRAQSGQTAMAAFMALVGAIALTGRLKIVQRMDALRTERRATGAMQVPAFRRLHNTGMVVNATLLICFVTLLMRFGI